MEEKTLRRIENGTSVCKHDNTVVVKLLRESARCEKHRFDSERKGIQVAGNIGKAGQNSETN
jgi:hypothetical protein